MPNLIEWNNTAERAICSDPDCKRAAAHADIHFCNFCDEPICGMGDCKARCKCSREGFLVVDYARKNIFPETNKVIVPSCTMMTCSDEDCGCEVQANKIKFCDMCNEPLCGDSTCRSMCYCYRSGNGQNRAWKIFTEALAELEKKRSA